MKRSRRTIFAAVIAGALVTGAILGLRPMPPPSVSVTLLGFTNRVGPHALLAVTNQSRSTITLEATCLVSYSGPQSSSRRVTSIDANRFRVTELQPHEGFVQEFFVFPASKTEWYFEGYAAQSSPWLHTRMSIERWLRRQSRRVGFPLTMNSWHKFTSEWFDCPD